jgi:protein O-mannosyl-transferase
MSTVSKKAAKQASVNSKGLSEKKLSRRILLAFAVLCFLIYGKSIGNGFAMDDEFVTYKNKQVEQGFKGIPEILNSTYITEGKQKYEYRPLVKVSYAIEYQLFGENPAVSHFINILFYILCVSILFLLLRELFADYHVLFSAVIALLFLVHPLHTEVVISLKNRDGMMSFIFCMLSLRYALRYADKNKLLALLPSALCMFLAMLSKRDALPFYVLIPFTVWYFRKIPLKRVLLIFVPFACAQLLFRLIALAATAGSSRRLLQWENPLYLDSSIVQRIPQGMHSLYFYVKMFVVPYPLLSYYGSNQVPLVGWGNAVVWFAVAGLVLFAWLFYKNIGRRPAWLYGAIVFFVSISMFLNIAIPVVGIVGERFAFFASLGLCIVAASLLFQLFRIPAEQPGLKVSAVSGSFWMVLLVISVVFGMEDFTRNKDWKDHYVLYRTDVKKAPESAHLNTLFAASSIQKVRENKNISAEEKRMHIANALFHYKESIRIIPDYTSSFNNIGMVYYTYYNKPAEAMPYLKKAIGLDTNYVEAFFNLASCEAALKDFASAEKHYLRVIELDHAFVSAYYSLSGIYAKDKRYDKILELNEKAISKGLRSDVPYINIGNVYFLQKDTLKALPYLEKGIELNPDNRFLNSFLADFYKEKGDLVKANHYYDLMSRSQK